jgi:hypothetical protein
LCAYLERVYIQYKQLEVAGLVGFYSGRVSELRRLYRRQQTEHDACDPTDDAQITRRIALSAQMGLCNCLACCLHSKAGGWSCID